MIYLNIGVRTLKELMFDYLTLGKELAVPSEIIQQFEEEAHKEFPFDNMLMEIHVLRAVKAYTNITERMVLVES